MRPLATLRNALNDPALLGNALGAQSWHSWRSVLLASMGEQLTSEELETFKLLTGRTVPPSTRVEEFVTVAGRRGGKSRAVAAMVSYIAALCEHDALAPGERGLVLCISPDQRQARVVLDYATGMFESSPVLSGLVVGRTADTLELQNKITIEARAASFRRLRGTTCVAVIADESAFWPTENSANPDSEILAAVRPALSTTRGMLFVISSPHARKGELWSLYHKHYGPNGDPAILVCRGSSLQFNPSLSARIVQRAYERDPVSARAEYGAEFRSDIESYIALEAVEAVIDRGVRERPPETRHAYVGFVDPSGGSADSMTLAIAHAENGLAILDAVREIRPPFSPDAVVQEFATFLKTYRVTVVRGDRYAGEWPRERFRVHGIKYEPNAAPKSELYRDLLPRLNARTCRLLDNDRIVSQLVGLERRTARGGKDSIDHAPNSHDDLANAVAGAVSVASAPRQQVHFGTMGDGGHIHWHKPDAPCPRLVVRGPGTGRRASDGKPYDNNERFIRW